VGDSGAVAVGHASVVWRWHVWHGQGVRERERERKVEADAWDWKNREGGGSDQWAWPEI
jgi:hypothetical protein